MKGDISLGDFIKKVKRELVTAQDKAGTAFFELKEVELEVSFVLDAKASAASVRAQCVNRHCSDDKSMKFAIGCSRSQFFSHGRSRLTSSCHRTCCIP